MRLGVLSGPSFSLNVVFHDICDWAKRFRKPAYWYPFQVGYDRPVGEAVYAIDTFRTVTCFGESNGSAVLVRTRALQAKQWPRSPCGQRQQSAASESKPRVLISHRVDQRCYWLRGVFVGDGAGGHSCCFRLKLENRKASGSRRAADAF